MLNYMQHPRIGFPEICTNNTCGTILFFGKVQAATSWIFCVKMDGWCQLYCCCWRFCCFWAELSLYAFFCSFSFSQLFFFLCWHNKILQRHYTYVQTEQFGKSEKLFFPFARFHWLKRLNVRWHAIPNK